MKRLLLTLLAISVTGAYAQKLPNVQQVSLRAPISVKIDGKATEWGPLQAYNKSVDVFYSLANDNDNLYVVIKASDKNVIYKIINGGISLTINPSMTKEASDSKRFTYPKFERTNFPSLNLDNLPIGKNGVRPTSLQIDSFSNAISKNLNDRAKLIGLSSGKADSDSLISIYNDLGVKVAQHFDSNLTYVYEISIPLLYLNTSINSRIAYNIKLNGMYATLPKGAVITTVIGGDAVLNAMNPTDFWSEYTLSK